MLDYIFSYSFLAYVVGFNMGLLAGAVLTAFRRTDELEGVGQGPVYRAGERAVRQAGPGGRCT